MDLRGWIWVWVVLGLFTLTLVLSHQGRGDVWLVCLVVCPFPAPHLWIADQVRNDGPGHPVDSRLRGNDGEGCGEDGLPRPCTSGLRIKSAMTGLAALWILP